MYKNNFLKDKEHWYVYFIRFKKDFLKTKFKSWYNKQINLWYWKNSVKIWSTHNKSRINDIWLELYENDLWFENIEIIRVIKCKKYRELEDYLHKKFKSKKCTFKNEYFNIDKADIFSDNYSDFWYISDTSEYKILYTQYKYFLKSLNLICNSEHHKISCLKYNRLFWGNF